MSATFFRQSAIADLRTNLRTFPSSGRNHETPPQPNDLGGHVEQKRCGIVFFDPWNHNKWKKNLSCEKTS